ncbi:vacuolar protein sorting-associated protein 41 homolog [Camellia sinensis]|uniref:vacuolar protein sorting-associated protein 41 homolog n=1 Tax=Camellia sinensis TaxID=4442 RepID=UPI0010368E22|nr:vacuolar protein sorting-associated protein 41 homolog [Camellia sinensis]
MADDLPGGGAPPDMDMDPEAKLLPLHIRPFDPAVYRPAIHVLPPNRLRKFRSFDRRVPSELLLREPETHLSYGASELWVCAYFSRLAPIPDEETPFGISFSHRFDITWQPWAPLPAAVRERFTGAEETARFRISLEDPVCRACISAHGMPIFGVIVLSILPFHEGNAQRPEVRVVTWNNDELTTDALPVHGFEHYKAKDYALAHVAFSGSSYVGGQWAAGDKPLYYIVSPKDVVIAKPRDAKDHISWLLQHGWHEKALAAVEAGQGRSELLDEVGSSYLDHLIVERKYTEAASLCPKLLRRSASAWERWVFHFAHLRQLPVLVPYIPTENPRLRDTAYEVSLVALTTNPSFHKDLLSTVKCWPPVIYSALPVISAIGPQLNTSSMTDALGEALAELYVIDGRYEKAFALYADLMKPDIFDFLEKHNLHDALREKVVQLMMTDCKRAVLFLTKHRDLITASKVVSQLLATGNKCDSRYFLHLYLLSLFEANPHAGRDFHDMQVCGKRIKFILENAFTLELVLFLTFGVMGRLNQKRLMG